MRRVPPPGSRAVSALVARFAHWRRCRRCHRLVLTFLPDTTPIPATSQYGITLGRGCPQCAERTERAPTPGALRLRKRLLFGLGSYRRCWGCGWSGLAVHPPRLLRLRHG
ncbi:hypothetical protein BH20GEM3_BH20GEM3_13800 [soil metagenome]